MVRKKTEKKPTVVFIDEEPMVPKKEPAPKREPVVPKKKIFKCPNCGYSGDTENQTGYVRCPACHNAAE